MKRISSLVVFTVLLSLASFGSQSPSRAHRSVQLTQGSKRGATAKWTVTNQSNPAPTNIGFLAAPTFPGGAVTNALFPSAIGDFNGDGNKDVAMVVFNPGTSNYSVSAALGNGDGTFQSPNLLTTNAAAGLWAGKVCGSSNDDLVVGHIGAPTTYEVLCSNGDGTFTSQGAIALGSGSQITWGALYLVNNDANLDLVFADSKNSLIWTALGNGNGTFQKATSVAFQSPAGGQGIAAGTSVVFTDFDGDGILDFAAHDAKTNAINVYYGTGSGYQAPVLLTDSAGADSCYDAAGDLNGDGKPEIISTNGSCISNGLQNSVTVYINNGNQTGFQAGVRYAVGVSPVADTIVDVNGDGNLDVVVSDCNSSDIRVLLGDGHGGLQQPASPGYATGGEPHAPPMVADFNNDGKPDVIVPNQRVGFVFLQNYGDGTFRSAMNFYANPKGNGFNPTSVGIASGDFNGDGITDFVIGNDNVSSNKPQTGLAIFISNPDGSMQQGVPLTSNATTENLQYVAVADFNGDGKLDLAATDSFNGRLKIFLGNGDGTFTFLTDFATDTTASSALGIVVGDFNGDGKPDVAVVNNTSATSADVGILINDGTGNFTLKANLPLSTIATELSVADLNGDGKLDLVVPLNGTSGTPGTAVAVFLGNGNGSFKPESDVNVGGQSPYYAAIGDVNGDGKPDMAVTVNDPNNPGVAVLYGKGDGTFQAPSLIAIAPQGAPSNVFLPYVKMTDLNRDGHLDIVYTNAWLNTVNVLYNKGDGTFPYDPLAHPASRFVWDFVLADANGDGVPDVVATGNGPLNGYAFSGVTVLLNTSGADLTLQSSAASTGNGQSVTFTATINPSKVRGVTTVPSGSITFLDGSTAISNPIPLSTNVVQFQYSKLAIGSHNIVAQYSGDVNYVVENSAAVKHSVLQPDYTLSASPSSQSVNPGSSGNYTITLSTTTGYDGNVTFSCPTSLPAGVSCVLPNMAPPYSPATLTLKTTGPSAALVAPQIRQNHDSNLWASLSGLGVFGLVLAGGKKRNRKHAAVALTIIALVLILALVGCGGSNSGGGGGGGGGGGNSGTPAGTYQIQVTATGTAGSHGGNTAAHPVTVTLVVQ